MDRYSWNAADYARYRPAYPAGLADVLASLSPRRERAWEAGCGSGQLTRLLAGRFDEVVATDPSPGQLDHAPDLTGVVWRVAAAGSSGLPSRSVDLAVAAQAAHWFDMAAYADEVRRVGRPDGVVALVTYGDVELDGEAGRVVDRFNHETLAGWWAPARRHVADRYRSLSFPFEAVAVPALPEMVARWDLEGFLGYVATWSGARALEEAEGEAPFRRFADALAGAWGSGPRSVRWPLTVRAGRIGTGG